MKWTDVLIFTNTKRNLYIYVSLLEQTLILPRNSCNFNKYYLDFNKKVGLCEDVYTIIVFFPRKAEVGPLRPALPKKSGNLATYVNESELLKKLVQLGTDLSKVERNREVCNYLLQTDFNTGIQPYLEFLLEKGVDKAELGNCLTKNAALLQENLEDLQVILRRHVSVVVDY